MTAATTKGMFAAQFLSMARRHLPAATVEQLRIDAGLPERSSPFGDCPIEPLTRFQESLIKRLYAGRTLEAGMRLLGHEAYRAFAESVSGRIFSSLLWYDAGHVSKLVLSNYRSINKLGPVEAELLGNNEFRLHFRNFRHYPQHQQGLLEEGVRQLRWPVVPELTVHSFERLGPGSVVASFDLHIRSVPKD